MTTRFDRFPDKNACRQAIAEMGNEVVLGGAPLWAVAKRRSQGPHAEKGGYYDWRDWGDLTISPEINQAVFSLPLQQMSRIIEDSEGFHIVRVIERREAHLVPFTEAQVEIKEKLRLRKRNEAISQYVEQLRKTTPVWTVYDTANHETSRQPSTQR